MEDNIIATITSDDEIALYEATRKLWKLGGYIYIDTPVITLNQKGFDIGGTLGGGIIGIKQPNGQYPRIDCKLLKEIYFDSIGLLIAGDNLKVQNIIIENAPSYGIFISGINNIIDHVITRYNGQSGIYANLQSDYNTFNYCYSYRNFLMPGMPSRKDGDGFTIELNSLNNKFNYCLLGTIVKVDLIIIIFILFKEVILQKILLIVIQLVGIMGIWMFFLENMTLIIEEN